MVIFDYIYFRIAEFSQRRWNDGAAEIRAMAAVTLLQVLLLIELVVIPLDYFTGYLKPGGSNAPALIGYFLVFGYNYLRYKRLKPLADLRTRWQGEEPDLRERRMLFIVILFVVTLGTVIAYSVLRNQPG